MEALICFLKRAKEGGYLLGFRVRGRCGKGKEVSYFLFANENLVVCKASQDQTAHLR